MSTRSSSGADRAQRSTMTRHFSSPLVLGPRHPLHVPDLVGARHRRSYGFGTFRMPDTERTEQLNGMVTGCRASLTGLTRPRRV